MIRERRSGFDSRERLVDAPRLMSETYTNSVRSHTPYN
jgi:hypothetical protein